MKALGFITFLLFLTLLPITGQAQTNSPAASPSIDDQIASVAKVFPQYFSTKYDAMEEFTTIEQINCDMLDGTHEGADYSVSLKIRVYLYKTNPIPEKICLWMTSYSDDWFYLKTHDVIIKIDEDRLHPDPNYVGDVITDGVIEHICPDLTLDQFRQAAWANSLTIRAGISTWEIPAATRQKWKLLWKHFDLIRAKQDADLKAVLDVK